MSFIGVLPILSPSGIGESSEYLEVIRNDEVFLEISVSLPQVFEISWIHSVELEEWREHFTIDINRIIRIESTHFRSFGAGVPDNAPQTSMKNGWVIMKGINRQVDPLVVRTNNESRHKLTIANQTYFLPEGQYRFFVLDVIPK